MPQTQGDTESHDGASTSNARVDALFCTPELLVLMQLRTRRPRQRCTFNMMAVWRSARLAQRPSILAVECAQRNLWCKLSISADKMAPIEEVLQDFIGMFRGLLPEHIVVVMTAIFNLDDEDADVLDEALLQHAGRR